VLVKLCDLASPRLQIAVKAERLAQRFCGVALCAPLVEPPVHSVRQDAEPGRAVGKRAFPLFHVLQIPGKLLQLRFALFGAGVFRPGPVPGFRFDDDLVRFDENVCESAGDGVLEPHMVFAAGNGCQPLLDAGADVLFVAQIADGGGEAGVGLVSQRAGGHGQRL